MFTKNAAYNSAQGVNVTYNAGKDGATNFEAQVGASTYDINLNKVAADVAGLLATTNYKSAMDCFENGTNTDITALTAFYTGDNAAQNYIEV